MAASSSASAGVFAVYLYDANFNRVALVDVPVPLPPVLTFGGLTYAWSRVHWAYTQTAPYTPQGDLGAPLLSVVADPFQF